MMERTSTQTTQPTDSRAARLEALRDDLDQRLDELATAGGSGLASVKERFDRAWKELNELLDPEATRH
jgi:ElaB/YqjD/DUF883 family membrane-anchored ribosome-binding protein